MSAPLTPPVRATAAGALIGFGVAAWTDEIVFYHLLDWNNRVNTSTFELGQVLDNAVHAAGIFTPLFGLVFAVGARRSGGTLRRALAGGSLLGAAFFRLIDLLVEHASTKLLQSHNPAEIALYGHLWAVAAWPLLFSGALLVLLPDRSPTKRRAPVQRLRTAPDPNPAGAARQLSRSPQHHVGSAHRARAAPAKPGRPLAAGAVQPGRTPRTPDDGPPTAGHRSRSGPQST